MKFILADPSHDAQLRALVRAETMPGHIRVTYEREPAFFQGLEIQGTFNQVVAAEENGCILGFGCRSIRPMFINGEKADFGYLSGLRSSLSAKQRQGIFRGYRTFKEQHKDGRCPGYITTIIEGNTEAFATIAQGRAGLPFYKNMGECRTYAIALNKRAKKPHSDISVRFAQPGEEATAIRLLSRLGKEHQFFPALSESDFGSPLLRNLSITNFLFAEQNGTACGIAAVWDQSAFKQHRIAAYSRPLRLAKPLLGIGLKFSGFSPLPKAGEQLRNAFLCFKAAENNDPETLAALLQQACAHLQHTGFSHCITGFHGNDPARSIIKPYPSTIYRSRLFFAGWKEDLETFNQLDERVPCFEPAIL